MPHVRFQVPFLGPESQLKSGFACAGLLCSSLNHFPFSFSTASKDQHDVLAGCGAYASCLNRSGSASCWLDGLR